jgi:Proteasome subunit
MAEKGLPVPKATSTGTTIVGCLFKDGIVLGADTRATEGPIVADKNCEKVLDSITHFIFFCIILFHKDSLYHRIYQMLRCRNGR